MIAIADQTPLLSHFKYKNILIVTIVNRRNILTLTIINYSNIGENTML